MEERGPIDPDDGPPRQPPRSLRGAGPGDRRPAALDQGGGLDLEQAAGAVRRRRRRRPSSCSKRPRGQLRSAGLSRSKVEFLRDLAKRVEGRATRPEAAARAPRRGRGRRADRGQGDRSLDRRDVPDLPPGAARTWSPPATSASAAPCRSPTASTSCPGPGELERIAEEWRPHRTLACLYLWRSLDNAPAIATRVRGRARRVSREREGPMKQAPVRDRGHGAGHGLDRRRVRRRRRRRIGRIVAEQGRVHRQGERHLQQGDDRAQPGRRGDLWRWPAAQSRGGGGVRHRHRRAQHPRPDRRHPRAGCPRGRRGRGQRDPRRRREPCSTTSRKTRRAPGGRPVRRR